MEPMDITIIGAGVIGLAVARSLGKSGRSITVLEKHEQFGQEISSRNSEVIHAGLYYPPGSLKAQTCVEGAALLYEYCRTHHIPYQRLGKLIVAVKPDELQRLDAIRRNAEYNGVQGLQELSRAEVRRMEPEVYALAGLYSRGTGVLSAHALMRSLANEAVSDGVLLVYGAEVIGIDRKDRHYRITIARDRYQYESQVVINCAGLWADRVAGLAGADRPEECLHWSKGEYFSTPRSFPIQHLIYPVPEETGHGLGVHLTRDLGGRFRFGPDATYVDQLDYSVSTAKRETFWDSIHSYLPAIRPEDLQPDMAGIRPRLQGPGEGFRDFIIRHEADRGFPGLIDLIGIESPGLTSALAIARRVQELAEQALS